jgi:hypothetical protein
MCDIREIVTAESLEHELRLVRASAADSISGIFGPQSLTWQTDREAAIFLGAGRALLLQLAHPWVAAPLNSIRIHLKILSGVSIAHSALCSRWCSGYLNRA